MYVVQISSASDLEALYHWESESVLIIDYYVEALTMHSLLSRINLSIGTSLPMLKLSAYSEPINE